MSKRRPVERATFAAVQGDILCTAGKAVKCEHKKNTSVLGGVKAIRCNINATKEVCSLAGQEIA